MIRFKYLFIISIIFHFGAFAQSPAGAREFSVKGRIVEKPSGQPLEYANLAVFSLRDSSLVSGTIAAMGGYFTIQIGQPGKYYAVADFMGYEQVHTDIFVLDNTNTVHQLGRIELKTSSIGLSDIDVVSERPAVSYKIDRKVIDVSGNSAIQGGTAIDALESLPSVTTDVDGSVSLRGNSNFTVLIDGRQTPLSGSDALSQIPASAISKIELITNPSAKYDPDGTSGIINIITKKGNMRGHSLVANASAGTSPSGSADASYTYRAKRYSLFVTAGGRRSENGFTTTSERIYYEPSLSGSEQIDIRQKGFRLWSNYFARVGTDLFLTADNTLYLGAGINIMDFGREYDARTTAMSTGLYENSVTHQSFDISPLQLQYNIGDRHVFGANEDHYLMGDIMFQTSQREKKDQAQRYGADTFWEAIYPAAGDAEASTDENERSFRGEFSYSRPLTDKHIVEAGVSLRNDHSRRDYSRWSNIGAQSVYTDTARFDRNIVAGYAITKGELKGIQYSAGLRAESTDQKIKTVRNNWNYTYNYLGWYPSLALTRPLTETSTLQASYSRRINRPRDQQTNPFPNLSDGYVLMTPNPNLQPEYATSLELNFQKTKGPHQLTAETFYRYTDNKMTRVSDLRGDTVVYTYINIGSETDAGLELTAVMKLSKWYSVQPVYTVSWNRVEGDFQGYYRRTSSVFTRANLTQTFGLGKKTKLQVMAYYNGKKKKIDGESLPAAWCSASVKRDFLDRKLSVSLRADDLFSSRKHESNSYSESSEIHSLSNGKGLTGTIAVSYRFNHQGKRAKESLRNQGGDSSEMDF